jgi:glucan biosynthesis protein C
MTDPPQVAVRYHYLDALRSVLMSLVVLFHSATIYAVGSQWIVVDPEQSAVLAFLNRAIQDFRMPGFFAVSGFFSLMSLTKYGSLGFLKKRLPRILLPLLSAALLLNSVQLYFQQAVIGGTGESFGEFLTGAYWSTWVDGSWVQHLWFLHHLVVFFLVSALLYGLARNRLDGWDLTKNRLAFWVVRHNLYLFLLAGIPIVFLGIANFYPPFLYTMLWNFLEIASLLRFAPFFFFGFLVFASETVRHHFFRFHWWQVPVYVLGRIVSLVVSPDGGVADKVVYYYLDALLGWITINWCFAAFHTFLDRPHPLFRYLSGASYTIYLFHHLIVVVLGYSLITVELPALVKFLIVLTVTGIATVAVHSLVISRSTLLSILFNGKPQANGLHPSR